MRRAYRGPILGISAVGLLVLGSATGFWRLSGFWPGADRPYSRAHQQLLASLESTRPTEARLSGDSSYHPYVPPPRIPESRSGQEAAKEAEAAIRREVRDSSPESRAALGILALVRGAPGEAVDLLRKAHTQKPEDPRILNDLAAALLAADTPTDRGAVLEALETALLSLRLQPIRPALFNQALALEKLGARAQAIAAWRRYLDEDSRSGWADEAAGRLKRLERLVSQRPPRLLTLLSEDSPDFTGNPWAARQFGERTLFARWAEHALAGRTAEADATLDRIEALATTLKPAAGRLLAASVSTLRDAEQSGDRSRLNQLARGHRAFGRAFLLRRQEKISEAQAEIAAAILDLRAAGSPFELRARLLRAWMEDPLDWAGLRQLEDEAQAQAFPSITAEARRILAYRLCLEGRFESSIRAYEEARRRFEALGEREEAAVVSVMRAELLEKLGRQRESALDLTLALQDGPWVADPWSRYSIYVVVAVTTAGRLPRVAVSFLQEAADACRDLPERPLCGVDASLWAAALTPDADVAEAFLEEAGNLLAAAPLSEGRQRTEIDLTAARARWLAGDGRSPEDWEEAADLFGEAASAYEAQGLAVSAASVRTGRARRLQLLARPQEAAAEYRTALRAFRLWDERDRFRPDRAEQTSPRELRGVYEALLELELKSSGSRPSPAAFLLSEEMRDRLAPRRTAGLWLPSGADLDRFVFSLSPGTAVIEYAVTPDRTVAWILTRGRFDQVFLTPSGPLAERIASLAGERNLGAWKITSGKLFQDLLAPVLKRLPQGTRRLMLVPDSELYNLPFRALWDPVSNRYLDEVFTISLAPSVRQILGSEERPLTAGGLAVLSLGFPEFSSDLGLDPLPHAGQEAEVVRRIYGSGTDCPATDWQGFSRCAPQADVLHLATHAAADSTEAGRNWLAFESETVSLDRLWRELPDLPRRPLVVLSACRSVTGAGGEGLGGLSRPFLASGARAVVGTLWRINDRDAARFFPAFHESWRRQGNAAAALQEAREEIAGWRERPWEWGGVEVMAGRPEAENSDWHDPQGSTENFLIVR